MALDPGGSYGAGKLQRNAILRVSNSSSWFVLFVSLIICGFSRWGSQPIVKAIRETIEAHQTQEDRLDIWMDFAENEDKMLNMHGAFFVRWKITIIEGIASETGF